VYTIVLTRAFVDLELLTDAYVAMVTWANNLRGTEVHIEGYPEGVVDSLKSLDTTVIGGSLLCAVVVNVEETGPIVEELDE
jgi:hypothetical protein